MYFSLILTVAFVFIILVLLVGGISGILIYFFPSLTFRAYRRILIDITYITAAFYGVMVAWSVRETQYFLQNNVLLFGSLLLFVLSPFSLTLRRHTFLIPVIWSIICLVWVLLKPIPTSVPF